MMSHKFIHILMGMYVFTSLLASEAAVHAAAADVSRPGELILIEREVAHKDNPAYVSNHLAVELYLGVRLPDGEIEVGGQRPCLDDCEVYRKETGVKVGQYLVGDNGLLCARFTNEAGDVSYTLSIVPERGLQLWRKRSVPGEGPVRVIDSLGALAGERQIGEVRKALFATLSAEQKEKIQQLIDEQEPDVIEHDRCEELTPVITSVLFGTVTAAIVGSLAYVGFFYPMAGHEAP